MGPPRTRRSKAPVRNARREAVVIDPRSQRGEGLLVERGEVCWITADPACDVAPNFAHPHVVLQDDVFNRSRVRTVIVCALTSNLRRMAEPGNVYLAAGEANLARPSVALVSQVSSIDKSRLGARVGLLSRERVEQIVAGLELQQRSFARDR